MNTKIFNEIQTDEYGLPIKNNLPDQKTIIENKIQISDETLWTEYSIKPNLPLRAKIEQLIILWRLTPEKIAFLLNIPIHTIKDEIIKLNKEWQELGQTPSEETRKIIRGRIIAELLRLKADIDIMAAGTNDSRLIALKVQVIEKLIKLQGIDIDKRELINEEETITNPVHLALDKLTDEQKEKLYNKLKISI